MDHGCTGKYLSFSDNISDLTCKKVEMARIWEDNEDILVQDQKESFGCLNLECCAQVESIIQGRFALVQAGCIVMVFFMILYLMNLQYMTKTISRYHVRFLNHRGDVWFFAMTVAAALALFIVKKFPGEPIANGS